jgi:hypothetical protein
MPSGMPIGLNISLFDQSSLEQTQIDGGVASDIPPHPAADSSQPSGPQDSSASHPTPPPSPSPSQGPAYTGLLIRGIGPSTARASSNGGVYVIRPTGASIPPIALPAGTYALVPSTFDPLFASFTLVVYSTSSAVTQRLR